MQSVDAFVTKQNIQLIILKDMELCCREYNFFYVLLTVHLDIFILAINHLMHKILFYNKFISCLYMFRAHVLIIRRSKLYYTASGIITPMGVMIQF